MAVDVERWVDRNLEVLGESGDELIALCPFHTDTNPSFYINKDSGLWMCHACGIAGNKDQLSQRLLGVEFGKQETKVSDLISAISKLTEAEDADRIVPESTLENYAFPTSYWREERGFSREAIDRFQLGFDPLADHATIPVRSETGVLRGVVRRTFGGGPKYLHPRGFTSAKHLFASWLHREIDGLAYLVEGPLDAVSLWDVGVPALAQFGSHLKESQASIVSRLGIHTVVIWPDNDQAGIDGIPITAQNLKGVRVKVVVPQPDLKDANDVPRRRRKRLAMNTVDWMTLQL